MLICTSSSVKKSASSQLTDLHATDTEVTARGQGENWASTKPPRSAARGSSATEAGSLLQPGGLGGLQGLRLPAAWDTKPNAADVRALPIRWQNYRCMIKKVKETVNIWSVSYFINVSLWICNLREPTLVFPAGQMRFYSILYKVMTWAFRHFLNPFQHTCVYTTL